MLLKESNDQKKDKTKLGKDRKKINIYVEKGKDKKKL